MNKEVLKTVKVTKFLKLTTNSNNIMTANIGSVMMLGKRITSSRKAKGWTQSELAQRLGVKEATIIDWESEESEPRASRLANMAGVLGVPLLWLIAGGEHPPEIGSHDIDRSRFLKEQLAQAEHKLDELSVILASIRAEIELSA